MLHNINTLVDQSLSVCALPNDSSESESESSSLLSAAAFFAGTAGCTGFLATGAASESESDSLSLLSAAAFFAGTAGFMAVVLSLVTSGVVASADAGAGAGAGAGA